MRINGNNIAYAKWMASKHQETESLGPNNQTMTDYLNSIKNTPKKFNNYVLSLFNYVLEHNTQDPPQDFKDLLTYLKNNAEATTKPLFLAQLKEIQDKATNRGGTDTLLSDTITAMNTQLGLSVDMKQKYAQIESDRWIAEELAKGNEQILTKMEKTEHGSQKTTYNTVRESFISDKNIDAFFPTSPHSTPEQRNELPQRVASSSSVQQPISLSSVGGEWYEGHIASLKSPVIVTNPTYTKEYAQANSQTLLLFGENAQEFDKNYIQDQLKYNDTCAKQDDTQAVIREFPNSCPIVTCPTVGATYPNTEKVLKEAKNQIDTSFELAKRKWNGGTYDKVAIPRLGEGIAGLNDKTTGEFQKKIRDHLRQKIEEFAKYVDSKKSPLQEPLLTEEQIKDRLEFLQNTWAVIPEPSTYFAQTVLQIGKSIDALPNAETQNSFYIQLIELKCQGRIDQQIPKPDENEKIQKFIDECKKPFNKDTLVQTYNDLLTAHSKDKDFNPLVLRMHQLVLKKYGQISYNQFASTIEKAALIKSEADLQRVALYYEHVKTFQEWEQIDVPSDGNCFFWTGAVALHHLVKKFHDNNQELAKLFTDPFKTCLLYTSPSPRD